MVIGAGVVLAAAGGIAALRLEDRPVLLGGLALGLLLCALVWTRNEVLIVMLSATYAMGLANAQVAFYVCVAGIAGAGLLLPGPHTRWPLRPPTGSWAVIAVALALWVGGSTLVGHGSIGAGLHYLAWAGVMAVFGAGIIRLLRLRGLTAIPWVLVAIAVLGAVQVLGETRGHIVDVSYEEHKHALKDLLGDAINARGLPLMIGPPVSMALALSRSSRSSWLAAGCWAITMAGVVSIFARASILGAVCGSAVAALLLMSASRARVVLLGVLGGGLAIVLWPLIRLTTSDDGNVASRGRLWSHAWNFVKESPIAGHGVDSWADLTSARALSVPADGAGGAHSALLETAVSGGLVAAGLQVGLLIAVSALGVRAVRTPVSQVGRTAAAAGVGGVVALVARGAFESNMWWGTRLEDVKGWVTVLGWILVAMIVVGSESSSGTAEGPEEGVRRLRITGAGESASTAPQPLARRADVWRN